MNIATKIVVALVVMAGCFAAGFFARKPGVRTETVVQTQIQEVERVVTKTVTEKVVTPDGTAKETVTTTTTQDSSKVAAERAPSESVPAMSLSVRPRWSLGMSWQPDFRDLTWRPAQGEVGYRVVGDLWVTGAYNWQEQHALVGVRWEF
jgi:hypothetical protein